MLSLSVDHHDRRGKFVRRSFHLGEMGVGYLCAIAEHCRCGASTVGLAQRGDSCGEGTGLDGPIRDVGDFLFSQESRVKPLDALGVPRRFAVLIRFLTELVGRLHELEAHSTTLVRRLQERLANVISAPHANRLVTR